MALRGFGATAPDFLEVIERENARGGTSYGPTATTYTPNPVLNPSTHRMLNAQYVPDRMASRTHVHSSEPFFLSLTQAEQNRFWTKELFGAEDVNSEDDDTGFKKRIASQMMIMGTTRQALPCNTYARLLKADGRVHGSSPLLRTVKSEPSIMRYVELDPKVTGSTMTFERQRRFKRKQIAHKGKDLLWAALHKKQASSSSGMDALRAVIKQQEAKELVPAQKKKARLKTWGIGERTANSSLDHFKQNGFEGSCKW